MQKQLNDKNQKNSEKNRQILITKKNQQGSIIKDLTNYIQNHNQSFQQKINIKNFLFFNLANKQLQKIHNQNFASDIYSLHAISKVQRNNDQIILFLKFYKKLTIPNLNKPTVVKKQLHQFLNLQQFVTDGYMIVFHEKLANNLQKEKIMMKLKQKINSLSVWSRFHLSQDQIRLRIKQYNQQKSSRKYIVIENVFQSYYKKVKSIHVSRQFIKTKIKDQTNFILQVLQKKQLTFKLLRQIDYKIYINKLLKYYSNVLEQYLDESIQLDQIQTQTFFFKGKIEDDQQKIQNVQLKWSCSHPSLIFIQILTQNQQNQLQLLFEHNKKQIQLYE